MYNVSLVSWVGRCSDTLANDEDRPQWQMEQGAKRNDNNAKIAQILINLSNGQVSDISTALISESEGGRPFLDLLVDLPAF